MKNTTDQLLVEYKPSEYQGAIIWLKVPPDNFYFSKKEGVIPPIKKLPVYMAAQ